MRGNREENIHTVPQNKMPLTNALQCQSNIPVKTKGVLKIVDTFVSSETTVHRTFNPGAFINSYKFRVPTFPKRGSILL